MRRWRRNSPAPVHALALHAHTLRGKAALARACRKTPPRFSSIHDGDLRRWTCSRTEQYHCGSHRHRFEGAVDDPLQETLPVNHHRLGLAPDLGDAPGRRAGHAEPVRPRSGADQERPGLAQRRRGGRNNFTVFHAKISKPFRDQFPPDKLQAIFKDPGRQARGVRCGRRPADHCRRGRRDRRQRRRLRLKGHFRHLAQAGEVSTRLRPLRRRMEALQAFRSISSNSKLVSFAS